MKKVKIFNKKISVFVVVLVGIGLVSAALLPYISNVITGMVTISQPMELAFDAEYSDFDYAVNIYGGQSFSFDTYQINHGDPMDIYNIIILVEGPAEWSGDEFTSVLLEDNRDPGNIRDITNCLYYIEDTGDLTPFSSIGSLSTNLARLYYDSDCNGIADKYTHGTDVEIVNHITITTEPRINDGDYEMKLFYTDDLETVKDVIF